MGSNKKCEDEAFSYIDGTFSDLESKGYEELKSSSSSTINDYLEDWTFPNFKNVKVDDEQEIFFEADDNRPLDRFVLRFIHDNRPEGNFTYSVFLLRTHTQTFYV